MCKVSQTIDPYARQYAQTYTLPPTKSEMQRLLEATEELRDLIVEAREWDRAHGQEDCEHADKIAIVRRVAALVGVDLEDALQA